jgi:hypothetical protein
MIPIGTSAAVAISLLGAAIAGLLAFPRSSLLRGARGDFKHETGAYLDPSFASAFDADTRRRYRLGAVFLLTMMTGLVVMLRFSRLDPVLVMAPLLAVTLALESANRLRVAGREFVVRESHPAVARVRRVTLSDYVQVRAQVLTWVAVTMVVTVAGRVLWRRHELGGPEVVAVTVGAATILAVAVYAAWFGRALCERPIPAVDASHLYLQDALRAHALERIGSMLRLSAVLFCMGISETAHGAVGYPIGMGMLGGGVVILLASLSLPRRHFRFRLWGTLAPGQVLVPGQPVPPRVGASA